MLNEMRNDMAACECSLTNQPHSDMCLRLVHALLSKLVEVVQQVGVDGLCRLWKVNVKLNEEMLRMRLQ